MSENDYERVVGTAVDAVDLFVPGIKAAIRELEEKHGPLTADLLRAFAIFQREGGEVADAVLDLTKFAARNADPRLMVKVPEDVMEAAIQHTSHEIAQCIAVLIYMLINLFGDRISATGEAPTLVPNPSDKVN